MLGLETLPAEPKLRAALCALSDEVVCLHAERARLRRQLQKSLQLADRDTLCPVLNRRAFRRELKREIARAARFGSPLSVTYLDLDGFKAVNDDFGHAAGDAVLERVAGILVDNTRETDIVARIGGDEFAIALPHATADDAARHAERLAGRIDRIRMRDGGAADGPVLRVSVSCGVAGWQPDMEAESLISRADAAMYAARASSGNDLKRT
jgi:diguanylate cyclase (GGDEF)-like protein